MILSPQPIARHEYDTARLMAGHRPVWLHPNKQVVYEISCPPGSVHRGWIGFSRWASTSLPATVGPVPAELVLARPGFYDYVPVLDPAEAVEWHVNFADPDLFFGYRGPLFAQDELQVAEHPALGALREALVAAGIAVTTRGPDGPTPVLVTGVERRASVATNPDPEAGRPHGLYGNAFARADPELVRRATTRVEPPTITNLVAIAAPSGGSGRYRRDTIEQILTTAVTGFAAAAAESQRLRGPAVRVAVHTGYWGCGAFGGNRVLMALLQVLAAAIAGLDLLAFHTGGPGGGAPLDEAFRILRDDLATRLPMPTHELVGRLEAFGFEWGVSDGT